MVVGVHAGIVAEAAPPVPSFEIGGSQVIASQLVASRAVGFLRIRNRYAHTTGKVFPRRNRLQVPWIDAARIPAQVVYVQAGGDGPR